MCIRDSYYSLDHYHYHYHYHYQYHYDCEYCYDYDYDYHTLLVSHPQMDMRNGRMGTATSGGEAGDSGDINGCTFPPEHGQAWRGGNGGQYGGGGGSG